MTAVKSRMSPVALRQAKKQIRSLNDTFMKNRLLRKGWHLERVEAAIEAYRRFLLDCARQIDGNGPTPDVDEVWHLHILNTRQYAADCQAVFGHYLHHLPDDADGAPVAARTAGCGSTCSSTGGGIPSCGRGK